MPHDPFLDPRPTDEAHYTHRNGIGHSNALMDKHRRMLERRQALFNAYLTAMQAVKSSSLLARIEDEVSDQDTNRDKALRGEVVKVTDDRLKEMQRQAIAFEGLGDGHYHWHWAAALNELIAIRAVVKEESK